MKIGTLLVELDKLNFPKDQYAITSSGSLAIRDIREANDLDIIVSPQLWEKLSKKYPVKKEGFESIEIGNIQILWKGSFFTDSKVATVEEQIKTADIIKGYRFVNLDLIKKFKQLGGREKDKKDLELIKNYEIFQSPLLSKLFLSKEFPFSKETPLLDFSLMNLSFIFVSSKSFLTTACSGFSPDFCKISPLENEKAR